MNAAGHNSGSSRQWQLGLIGCGRFGTFCLQQVQRWQRARAAAVTDAAPAVAQAAAREFGAAACVSAEELLARTEVEVVLISTPPDTHYPLAMQVLRAGKHVICEKPLALTVEQGEEMIRAATAAGLLLAVNHLLRYNPLVSAVKQLIESRALGEPLHYVFENYAEDERLPSEHWFWDPRRSGGIFVEHGVHFFDLYRWWLGGARVAAAGFERRPGTGMTDRAWCALRHQQGTMGQQYHGFDQPARLDRAEHRLLFERGEAALRGWIPLELSAQGIVSREQQELLAGICGAGGMRIIEHYDGSRQICRGRGQRYVVSAHVEVRRVLTRDKTQVYGDMVRAFLDDQLRTLEQPGHRPRATAKEAMEALRLAEQATAIAAAEQR